MDQQQARAPFSTIRVVAIVDGDDDDDNDDDYGRIC